MLKKIKGQHCENCFTFFRDVDLAYKNIGSGALIGKIFLVKIIENDKINA